MKKDKKDFFVSYKEVKEKVSLKMVLERYHVLDTMKPSGNNYTCCCPIHKGTNSRQFSANFERNIWQCFGDPSGWQCARFCGSNGEYQYP